MAYVITAKELATNAGLAAQAKEIQGMRRWFMANEARMKSQAQFSGYDEAVMACNAAMIPDTWFLARDTETVQMMGQDDGLTLLNDLAGLSRNVNIGKLVADYRRYGADAFEVRTSLDGQHDKPVDRGYYNYDGTLIPVHTAGISMPWRELAGQRTEGLDQLADDQRQAVTAVRKRMAATIYDGIPGMEFKGYKALGIRNSPNVIAFDINSLPSNSVIGATPSQLREAFRSAISALRSEQNGATGRVDFYVSAAIWERMGEIYTQTDTMSGTTIVMGMETILDVLKRLPDMGEVKQDTSLYGEEFVAVIRRREYIQPVVGMPVTNTPIDRRTPMDNYQVLTWSAMGILIKADAQGRSGVLYASK